MEVKNISMARIFPSPMNPRKTFDLGDLQELADNIAQHGLIQPIIVRAIPPSDADPLGGDFEIVCGERRFRAVRLNGGEEIACIVRNNLTDEQAFDAMITENLQRKDVDPIEEAFAFGQLHARGKSINEIALRFGKSDRFITERIKLDKLLPELKRWVTKGWMHVGAAMHLCKLTEDEQRQFLENYVGEEIGDDTEPITKQDAVDFTNNLFMRIERADWSDGFKGSCGTTCADCPHNNANAGCLFYEMKVKDATCTNRAAWNRKRSDWLMNVIEENAAVLVREGEELEAGKTLVLKNDSFYADRCDDYKPTLDKVAAMGFRIAEAEDFFERFSYYGKDDDRLKEKLAANEVYRCLVIEAAYRGTEISERYYQWKKRTEDGETEAMRLVNAYRENERKSETSLSSKLSGLFSAMDPDELGNGPLSRAESLALLTLILRKTSHTFRDGRGLVSYSSEAKELTYATEHADEANLICRDFIRNELAQGGTQYYADLRECQGMLLDEWLKEEAAEVKAKAAEALAKKQEKIVEQLAALGYNPDGTKTEKK